ncbi:MAG: hypothetical protein A2163_05245 [Actinobacteria bacterium RBG_13_35_12]|nr:MAG: hypothetical protein A2163_05245 [Actinobacteria bacterium RBG_13_35_12]
MTKRSMGMTIFRNDNIPLIFLNNFVLKYFQLKGFFDLNGELLIYNDNTIMDFCFRRNNR